MLLPGLLLLTPGIADACSQCLSGRSEATKLAYVLTTVFLSLMPLLVVGGLVWWLVRRVRAVEALSPLPVDRAPLEG